MRKYQEKPRLGGRGASEHVSGQYSSRLPRSWKTRKDGETLSNQRRHGDMAIKYKRALKKKIGEIQPFPPPPHQYNQSSGGENVQQFIPQRTNFPKTSRAPTQQSKNVLRGICQEKTEVRIWMNTSHNGNINSFKHMKKKVKHFSHNRHTNESYTDIIFIYQIGKYKKILNNDGWKGLRARLRIPPSGSWGKYGSLTSCNINPEDRWQYSGSAMY